LGNKSILWAVFLIFLFFNASVYGVEEDAMVMEGMETDHGVHSESKGLGTLHNLHIVQIIVLLFVAILIYEVIRSDPQKNILIYLLIPILIFAISALFAHLPHVSGFPHESSRQISIILNTIALVMMAIGFYKWRKTLL